MGWCSAARRRFAVLTSLALTACATPIVYGALAAGSGFGYRDTPNTDGSHTILVVAPSSAMAHEFWGRRAQELCNGPNFTKNLFRAEIPVVTASGYAVNAYNPAYGGSYTVDVYGAFHLEGYLRCGEGNPAPALVVEQTAAAAPEAPAATP